MIMPEMRTPKRPATVETAADGAPESAVKQRRMRPAEPRWLEVGDWVTLKPTSRRQVDIMKASAPCLVTSVAGAFVRVLYPNRLSLFMREKSGTDLIRCRTEQCPVENVRLCRKEDVAGLDRKLVLFLCSALAPQQQVFAAAPQGCTIALPSVATEEAPLPDVGGGADTQVSEEVTLDGKRLHELIAGVARAFEAAGRDVMEMAKLEAALAAEFSKQEVAAGLSELDRQNKLMVADDSVFRIC